MLIYFLVAISPLVISYFFPKLNIDNKTKKKYLIVCGILLVLFIGLRSKYLGSEDSFNYYRHMQRAITCDSWNSFYIPNGFEVGFQFFVFFISKIFPSAQMLFVTTAVIYISTIFYCIYKYSDNVVLSMVMYITLGLMQFQMQGMRQAIAISLCLIAFDFANKKKLVPFILLIILATSFHRTAIIFAIVYLVTYLPYTWLVLIPLGIGSVFLFFYSDVIMVFANNIFDAEYSRTIDSGGFVATAIYILIIVFAMLFHRKSLYKKDDKTQATIMYIAIIGLVSYIMRYFGVGISERISFYFMFTQILLLPNTITNISKDYKKATTIGVYVMCILLFLYRLRGSEFIPYEFFWQ